jgi:site-specific DNA-methyltransferase (adenine-specific)
MTILHGDALEIIKGMEDNSIDFCFTSPTPFRQGSQGIGSEDNEFQYIINLTNIFTELYRVVKPTGCFWINLSDRHDENGVHHNLAETFVIYMKVHNMWRLRSRCYWVRTEKWDYQEDYNRFARDVEYLYFFTKSKDHYFNNPRQRVQSSIFYADYKQPKGNSFESGFPEKIIERCIQLSCPEKGVVLDPLCDSATTAVVAKRMGRPYIMIDISYDKVLAAKARLGEK